MPEERKPSGIIGTKPTQPAAAASPQTPTPPEFHEPHEDGVKVNQEEAAQDKQAQLARDEKLKAASASETKGNEENLANREKILGEAKPQDPLAAQARDAEVKQERQKLANEITRLQRKEEDMRRSLEDKELQIREDADEAKRQALQEDRTFMTGVFNDRLRRYTAQVDEATSRAATTLRDRITRIDAITKRVPGFKAIKLEAEHEAELAELSAAVRHARAGLEEVAAALEQMGKSIENPVPTPIP